MVRTADGSFVNTEALVEVAEVVELQAYEPGKPSTRLRGKQPFPVPGGSDEPSSSSRAAAIPVVAVARRGGGVPKADTGSGSGGEYEFFVPRTQPLTGILVKDKSPRPPKKDRFEVPDPSQSEDQICNTQGVSLGLPREQRASLFGPPGLSLPAIQSKPLRPRMVFAVGNESVARPRKPYASASFPC